MPVRTLPGKPRAARPAAGAVPRPEEAPAVPESIITMDASGTIQSASDSVEEVFGWTPSELFGLNVKVLIPEPRRSALDRYLDRYRMANPARTLQRTRLLEAVRKDGRPIQIELSMSRADLPAQAAPYFIGIIRDVGRRIDVAGDTPETRSRLQHLVTEQTRALATAHLRLHLADRLAALGTLAAGLGHDLNNVLLPIRARLNALEHAGITPAALAHLEAVRRSIGYLQHLSDGLHFLAADPDSGVAPANSGGATRLCDWWEQVGPLLRKALPPRIIITASLPTTLPPVNLAPHWLTQAVLNLLVNAGEAMPNGRRRPQVRLTATHDANSGMVRLAVIDNGRGMAPGIQRRALDLFFTTKARSMGTGLGLPMARKVAVRAGGSLEIRSTVGKGTTAVLILPTARLQAAPAVETTGARTAVVSVGSRRAAALLLQALGLAQVRVRTAPTGRPGSVDLWVVEPTPAALRKAEAWWRRGPRRAVVVLGRPSAGSRARWDAIHATIIDPPGSIETTRHALGHALSIWAPTGAGKGKP